MFFLFFVFFLMWTISKLFIFGQEACGISAPRPTPPARQGEEGLIAGEVPKRAYLFRRPGILYTKYFTMQTILANIL